MTLPLRPSYDKSTTDYDRDICGKELFSRIIRSKSSYNYALAVTRIFDRVLRSQQYRLKVLHGRHHTSLLTTRL